MFVFQGIQGIICIGLFSLHFRSMGICSSKASTTIVLYCFIVLQLSCHGTGMGTTCFESGDKGMSGYMY